MQGMSDTTTDPDNRQQCFVITPNCSLSWRGAKWFFCIAFATSLTIATGFAMMGAWMVFPFAGLEMAALATVLYLCARHSTRREVVAIDDQTVRVMKGRRTPEEDYHFNRAWARVEVIQSHKDWYPSRLLICSHGREVEVGNCLCEEEKQLLAKKLSHAIT
jgi:uncharacterized membrane protein